MLRSRSRWPGPFKAPAPLTFRSPLLAPPAGRLGPENAARSREVRLLLAATTSGSTTRPKSTGGGSLGLAPSRRTRMRMPAVPRPRARGSLSLLRRLRPGSIAAGPSLMAARAAGYPRAGMGPLRTGVRPGSK
jgi:hypothetical protein